MVRCCCGRCCYGREMRRGKRERGARGKGRQRCAAPLRASRRERQRRAREWLEYSCTTRKDAALAEPFSRHCLCIITAQS